MPHNQLDVKAASLPGQQSFAGTTFPFVFEGSTDNGSLDGARQWIENRRDELLALADEHGAILFRGFPFASAEDFDAFIEAFGLPNFPYEKSLSNAVRVSYTSRVFSANEAPPDVKIYLHHEMAQTPIFPSKLFFFCVQPAASGGATPICRSDVLMERLTRQCPEFARDCEEKGLQYTNVMPAENDPQSGMGRSWKSMLGVDSRDEAERRLAELDYSWEWLPDGCLRATTPVLPGVRKIAPGRKTFFNQLIAAFQGWKDSRNDPAKAIRFGDGSPLDRRAVDVATELGEELSFDVPWQRGDAVLVNNLLAMHGRRTFAGTRKVLASLADAHTHGL